jgi:UDP-N-acetylmuramate dehydrogenase
MSPPPEVERGFPLARLTTVRTGGPAEYFARAGDDATLHELLAWAAEEGLEVGVVGSGSNLLVADEGVEGLVIKLDRDLGTIEREGTRLRCGGGARPAPASPAWSSGSTSRGRWAAR